MTAINVPMWAWGTVAIWGHCRVSFNSRSQLESRLQICRGANRAPTKNMTAVIPYAADMKKAAIRAIQDGVKFFESRNFFVLDWCKKNFWCWESKCCGVKKIFRMV